MRRTGDVAEIEELLLAGVINLLSCLFRIVFFVAALLYLIWKLARPAFLTAPLFWLTSHPFPARIEAIAREQPWSSGVTNAIAKESQAMAPLTETCNREPVENARFHRQGIGNLTTQMHLSRMPEFFAPLLDLVEPAEVLVAVGAGARPEPIGDLRLSRRQCETNRRVARSAAYRATLNAPVLSHPRRAG